MPRTTPPPDLYDNSVMRFDQSSVYESWLRATTTSTPTPIPDLTTQSKILTIAFAIGIVYVIPLITYWISIQIDNL